MGVFENMAREPVSRLNLRDPVMVRADVTVGEAVQRMREHHLGCAIIVGEDNKPLGMFTESMLTQLVSQEVDFADHAVSEYMASNWPWGRMDDPIVDVLGAMELKNVRFVCVLDEGRRVAGLTGQKGLMEYIADHFPDEVLVQRVGGAAHPQEREGA